MGRKKKTPEKFIKQAVELYGDKYSYEEMNYVDGTTPVRIFAIHTMSIFIKHLGDILTTRLAVHCALLEPRQSGERSGLRQNLSIRQRLLYWHLKVCTVTNTITP